MSDPTSGYAQDDSEVVDAESKETVTNDAVAGETVLPEPGDGDGGGPTGGSPREAEPDFDNGQESTDLGGSDYENEIIRESEG